MKRFIFSTRWSLILLLIALASALIGCATSDEPENTSSRPWNAPVKGWDSGGMPGYMNQNH